jgi:hypothetical protein
VKFDFENLPSLLRQRADEPAVVRFVERDPDQIERSAYLGWVSFKEHGMSVMFVEAARLIPAPQTTDPGDLHVSAFHLHRQNHEGFAQYCGKLPGGVVFGDSKEDIIRKLGSPLTTGGGGYSDILKKPIPCWIRYAVANALLHFQLDAEGKLEMATLFIPDRELIRDEHRKK